MIKTFADKETETFWLTGRSRKIPGNIQKRAYRKLQIIDAAMKLEDLRAPPSNQLEKLQGNRKEFYSIRINKQWRICFCMDNTNVIAVEIVDYH
jgi:proteic killer suppression protein